MKPIPITIRQIDYVIATADEGSTAAAARLLNVSQPSVSLAIAKVEKHLGRPLFARSSGQGIVLTSFGLRKLGEFRSLQTQARQVLSVDGTEREILNLGVFSTLGPRYAPSLVHGFQAENTTTDIRIHEADLETLTFWLECGQIDLALIYEFGLPSSLEVISLADVRPFGLLPKNHHLADRTSVSMAELLEYPLILMNLPQSRDYFLTLAQMYGLIPKIAHETVSIEMLRSMVANGLGVGLLATDIPHETTYDLKTIVRMPLKGSLAPHRIALAKSRHLQSSNLMNKFINYAIKTFEV